MEDLAKLPELEPSDALRRRTLARSRHRLEASLALAHRPVRRFLVDLVTPALVLGGAASYLVWAVQCCNHG
ncbi:MAG: hypothetical protein ABI321_13170 [Polyangia bacterium]